MITNSQQGGGAESNIIADIGLVFQNDIPVLGLKYGPLAI